MKNKKMGSDYPGLVFYADGSGLRFRSRNARQ